MNAHELSLAMAAEAAGIAQHLLPRGKRVAGEWKVGSTAGDEGQSLSIRLSGAKRGVWKDFAADQGGDLLDLWATVRGQSIAEAMVDAKAYLGINDTMPPRERPSFKRPPQRPQKVPESKVRAWLLGRSLTDKTLADFKIGEIEKNGKHIAVFPYWRDGELVNAKYRNVESKREMRQEAGAEPCLFGWHLIDPKVRSVIITEGEIDAMTLHQMGFPALSVNAGAGNHQWVENDWDRLERFSELLICFDNDEAGQKGAAELIQRLGIERCKLVKLPAKDANQFLMDGADLEMFDDAIQKATYVDPQELVGIADYFALVKGMLYPAPGAVTHPFLMLGPEHEDCFQFRPGELSVWTGINGHGKSLMLNQVLIGLMSQGERVCVFSGEMTPASQAMRCVRQLCGTARPMPAYIDAAADWIRHRMWIFNVVGSAKISRLLEVFAYAAKRYGISHFVIDSLMMTDVPDDGPGAFTAQKKAVQELSAFAKQYRAHVHLVAHPRKGKDEMNAPGKLDIGGSGKITDGADNVFSVYAWLGEDPRPQAEQDAKPRADAMLTLHKQRNGEIQYRKFYRFFHPGSQQYCPTARRVPKAYVDFKAEREVA